MDTLFVNSPAVPRAGAPLWAVSAALALILVGCGSHRDRSVAVAASPLGSGEANYLTPPQPVSVRVGPDGGLAVSGLAPLRSTVMVMSPEGEQANTRADARGGWSARLAAAPEPRLYAISASVEGRTVHAEGALITAPGAATPAVMVRAGYAASPLGSHRATDIASVDYDPSGFIAVAGYAPAHAQLALMVDGAAAAVGQADGEGRYALLAANRRLAMGVHQLQLRAPDGAPARPVTLVTPVTLSAPYQAWREPDGWRVEWGLTGGGVQTTLILDRQVTPGGSG